MGVFSDNLQDEVRLEYMRPEAIEAAKEKQPAIYVPFGSIELHGYHNAVGLDSLKAHEQLVGLAVRVGGLVYPPVYFGSGGCHADFPSTFMVSGGPMVPVITELLHGFEAKGYKKAVLLSGHYPNRGEFIDAAVEAFKSAGGGMNILAIVECEVPDVDGDHGAKNETSFMLYLHPETVDMERLKLGPQDDIGPPDVRGWWLGDEFVDHPCYGLAGIDPRGRATSEAGRLNTEKLLAFLENWVTTEG